MAHLESFRSAEYAYYHAVVKRSKADARLVKRILLTLAVACGLLLLLAPDANATPIRPDVRTLVAQPQPETPPYAPARAGWDGPEMQAVHSALLDADEKAAALARAERAELIAAATPDLGVVLGIAALIFLLRLLRRREENRQAATHDVPGLQAGDRVAA